MSAPTEDLRGELATCPSCGETFRAGAMIPVLAESGAGIAYLCPACASKLGRNEAPTASGRESGGH